tara:strand:- start:139 stop:567 length:429 start_codon:yes stop_codon:yes gene_type:complete
MGSTVRREVMLTIVFMMVATCMIDAPSLDHPSLVLPSLVLPMALSNEALNTTVRKVDLVMVRQFMGGKTEGPSSIPMIDITVSTRMLPEGLKVDQVNDLHKVSHRLDQATPVLLMTLEIHVPQLHLDHPRCPCGFLLKFRIS